MSPEMYTVIVWSVVVPVACSVDSPCDIDHLIGSCENISGPVITCSQELYDHVGAILQLSEELPKLSIYSETKPFVVELYKIKDLINNLIDFVKETATQQPIISNKTCMSIDVLEWKTQELDVTLSHTYAIFYWMDHIFPSLGTMIFIFGMVGNLMIVLMYSKHDNLQTGSNKVVLNLAVADMLLLICRIPVMYFTFRWLSYETIPNWNWLFYNLDISSNCVNVYLLVVLSFMKYLAASAKPGSKTQEFIENNKAICILLAFVWVLAVIVGVIRSLTELYVTKNQIKSTLDYVTFVFLCPLPLVIIAFFSIATSRILKTPIPGEQTPAMIQQTRARRRGANVLFSFVIVFAITHVPYNVRILITKFGIHSPFISVLLLTLNACLNPLALFVSSRQFRNQLRTDCTKIKQLISQIGQ